MSNVPESVRKDRAAMAGRPESDIDFSELPPTTAEDWQDAEHGTLYRRLKQQLTVRIDADVLACPKSQGKA